MSRLVRIDDWENPVCDRCQNQRVLVIPDSMDLVAESKAYAEWYNSPGQSRFDFQGRFISFTQWCVNRGANYPGKKDLPIFDADEGKYL